MAIPARQKRALDRQPPHGVRVREGVCDAFTAVELLVAVAVLAMMITMVSGILASSKRLATTSQAKMRANSTASAITETIRDDLRRASKNGLLCITQIAGGRMRLALAVPGVVRSLTSNVQGTGEFVCYGLVDNQADPGSDINDILFRAGWIMSDHAGGADVISLPNISGAPGYKPYDFSVLGFYERAELNSLVSYMLKEGDLDSLRVPPVTLTDINNLWQIASAFCSELTIQWSDGTLAPDGENLRWYGPGSPKNSGWSSVGVDDNVIEFDAHGDGTYRALWTQHNQSNWPKAVKFRFRLRDPDMPVEFSNVDYEVVCPIGQ